MRKTILLGLIVLLLLVPTPSRCFGAGSFAVYQVEGTDQRYWSLVRDFFREKGYDVLIQQGDVQLDEHLERMSSINRSSAKFLLAIEFLSGEGTDVLVAMTDRKGVEEGAPGNKNASALTTDAQAGNRFLAIDDLQGKYASDSARLAEAVAGAFQVKVKHVPLFPLLGADMPGIFLRVECKQDKIGEILGLLHGGIQNYLRRDMPHEK